VVLRRGRQPVEKLRRRGALVRLVGVALPEVDERVRLLPAGGDDAARAVILEGPPHDPLAVGHQRGGERVAGMAGEALAVEGELHLAGAVDQAAATGQTRAHARPSQSGRFALMAATMSAGGSDVWAG
jgi:NaMN:DMB phosphoribosyltransferase